MRGQGRTCAGTEDCTGGSAGQTPTTFSGHVGLALLHDMMHGYYRDLHRGTPSALGTPCVSESPGEQERGREGGGVSKSVLTA